MCLMCLTILAPHPLLASKVPMYIGIGEVEVLRLRGPPLAHRAAVVEHGPAAAEDTAGERSVRVAGGTAHVPRLPVWHVRATTVRSHAHLFQPPTMLCFRSSWVPQAPVSVTQTLVCAGQRRQSAAQAWWGVGSERHCAPRLSQVSHAAAEPSPRAARPASTEPTSERAPPCCRPRYPRLPPTRPGGGPTGPCSSQMAHTRGRKGSFCGSSECS